MEYSYKSEMQSQHIMKKTVVTSSSVTTTRFQGESEKNLRLVEMEAEGQPFSRQDVKMFPTGEAYSTISSESFSCKSVNDKYSSVYERSDATKMIGGGENQRIVEHFTKSSGHGDEQPMVVMKNGSQIDVPEWMEERKFTGTERRDVDTSNIDVFLKYPSDYSPKEKEAEDKINETKIRPEVAKQDKQVIHVLPVEDSEGEESEDEYEEFEEEIVVVDVRRKPIWRKGLEIPKPEPEKVGVPIKDLLEIPTLQAKQESSPDEPLIDEKIEFVERPPVVYAELPDLGILDNL